MVHALEKIRRLLKPSGRLIDIHPMDRPPPVAVRLGLHTHRLGCLRETDDSIEYRQADAAGGAFKLSGVQKRVETMLTMTGAHNFLEVHADEATALASFGE